MHKKSRPFAKSAKLKYEEYEGNEEYEGELLEKMCNENRYATLLHWVAH